MARRCTTVPGYGTCCRAAQQGLLNAPFKMTDHLGHIRCAECSTRPSTSRAHPGRTVFQFRWHKNSECGLGTGGCPYLGGQPGGIGLPAPTGQGAPSLGA